MDTGLREDIAEAGCDAKAGEGFPVCKEEQRTGRITMAMQVRLRGWQLGRARHQFEEETA